MHLETCQRCLGRKRDLLFNQFFGKDYPPYYVIDKDVHARELPLILFTLLTQIGVGAFIALMMVKLIIWFRFPGLDYQWTLKGYVGILLTTVFAMFFSLTHLAAPSRGVRALANFRTSWLSREIFFTGIFFILTGVNFLFLIKSILPVPLLLVFDSATGIMGLIAIYAQAKAYMIFTHPTWYSKQTLMNFYRTSLRVGPLFLAAVIVTSPTVYPFSQTLVCIWATLLALITTLVGWKNLYKKEKITPLAPKEWFRSGRGEKITIATGGLLLPIFFLVFIVFLPEKMTFGLMSMVIGSSFLLVLIGEILARAQFYKTGLKLNFLPYGAGKSNS